MGYTAEGTRKRRDKRNHKYGLVYSFNRTSNGRIAPLGLQALQQLERARTVGLPPYAQTVHHHDEQVQVIRLHDLRQVKVM